MSARASTRVRSIAIGGRDEFGRQRYATPLELEAEPAAATVLEAWVDWSGVADALRLSPRERKYFLHVYRDERSPRELGLSAHQAGIQKRDIDRKLAKNREALRPVAGFITPGEKKFAASPRNPDFQRTFVAMHQEILDLGVRLNEARARYSRLRDGSREAETNRLAAETEITRLQASIRADQQQAILEERPWPNPKTAKQIEAARERSATATAVSEATDGAIQKQAEIVKELEDTLTTKRRDYFGVAIDEPAQRVHAAILALQNAIVDCEAVAASCGCNGLDVMNALVPYNQADPISGMTVRQLRYTIIQSAATLRGWEVRIAAESAA